MDVERRLAKEMTATLALKLEQLALDRADARFGNVAVSRRQAVRIFGTVRQHCLKVAKVEQQQTFLIRIFEGDRQHTFLRFVKAHQPRQQQGSHFADGSADRMALVAIEIPEDRGVIGKAVICDADFLGARSQFVGILRHG